MMRRLVAAFEWEYILVALLAAQSVAAIVTTLAEVLR